MVKRKKEGWTSKGKKLASERAPASSPEQSLLYTNTVPPGTLQYTSIYPADEMASLGKTVMLRQRIMDSLAMHLLI